MDYGNRATVALRYCHNGYESNGDIYVSCDDGWYYVRTCGW